MTLKCAGCGREPRPDEKLVRAGSIMGSPFCPQCEPKPRKRLATDTCKRCGHARRLHVSTGCIWYRVQFVAGCTLAKSCDCLEFIERR